MNPSFYFYESTSRLTEESHCVTFVISLKLGVLFFDYRKRLHSFQLWLAVSAELYNMIYEDLNKNKANLYWK